MAYPNQTTLSAAITNEQVTFGVASATGLTAPVQGVQQQIYVLEPGTYRGELMNVVAVNGTQVTVVRLSEFRGKHLSGAIVIIQNPDPTAEPVFITKDPSPSPMSVPTQTFVINVTTGSQWIYSTVTNSWVPGYVNGTGAPLSPTAAVASPAGQITPTGPLFHVTGTNAITGIVLPLGFIGGTITMIPDGVFSWTTANNIIVASGTIVVGIPITFTYDFNTGKFYPDFASSV